MRAAPGRLKAVLGPTNTGKTHLAVERMLGHRSGMIGLPLRLLAREIYERVVASKGARHVALMTGEERIVPEGARYHVCTTESMPLDRAVEFLAVDEIQLCADGKRGHIFTDRLLRARGTAETMVMGAATMRNVVRALVPDTSLIARPRMSGLSHAGYRKVTRLPARSAVVAFSVADVYELAEILRRQRGGCAVVLGALSPRVRNAQVAMYQAGEVDHIVATDAIGMGLNMDVDHVAFAALRKFDGARPHELGPAELAQIAGRAGRHTNDGSFGTTWKAAGLDGSVAAAIEDSAFGEVPTVMWRNADLDFRSARALLGSLDRRSGNPLLVKARTAADHAALADLLRDPDVVRLAATPETVSRLWEVCQIPDFRKVMHDHHVRLLAHIFRHLTGPRGRLPEDWVMRSIERLDRGDGDLDLLMTRIAHIRTWTYIAHRSGWVRDHGALREATRRIEDRLSDALHERLIRRFVDRRMMSVARDLKGRGELRTAIGGEGQVVVEDEAVGHVAGLQFRPAHRPRLKLDRALLRAAQRAAAPEIARRARRLAADCAEAFRIDDTLAVVWRGETVARLVPGPGVLSPAVRLPDSGDLLDPVAARRVRQRLDNWLEGRIAADLKPLLCLRDAGLEGAARGIAFQLEEGLGVATGRSCLRLARELDDDARRGLARLGVRFGVFGAYLKALMSPLGLPMRAVLWSLASGRTRVPEVPARGETALDADDGLDDGFYRAIGYRRFGKRALRADMAERLALELRRATRGGPAVASGDLVSLSGSSREAFVDIAEALGFRASANDGDVTVGPRPRGNRKRAGGPRRGGDPESPFARLAGLEIAR